MERITYWVLRGAQWDQVRAFFASVLRGVEAHELAWNDDWGSLESMMIDKPDASAVIKPDRGEKEKSVSIKKVRAASKSRDKEDKREEKRESKVGKVWFCKEYNSVSGCA